MERFFGLAVHAASTTCTVICRTLTEPERKLSSIHHWRDSEQQPDPAATVVSQCPSRREGIRWGLVFGVAVSGFTARQNRSTSAETSRFALGAGHAAAASSSSVRS